MPATSSAISLAGGASSLVKALLQLAMLPLMGRLLGPKEFGLYAMALPIVTFFTVVADGGLGASLAKERSPDPTVWNTAFWVMLALGICLAGLVNVCGYGLAAFMHEPRLHALLALLSINFLFIADLHPAVGPALSSATISCLCRRSTRWRLSSAPASPSASPGTASAP